MRIAMLFLSLLVSYTIARYELVLGRIDDNLLPQLGLDDNTNIIDEEAVRLRIDRRMDEPKRSSYATLGYDSRLVTPSLFTIMPSKKS